MTETISKASLARLPDYLRYLQGKKSLENISSSTIAEELNLSAILVRKDLAIVSSVQGKPRTGYNTYELIKDLERYLGYDNVTEVALVGVGHLGQALLSYGGFSACGMQIMLAFDSNPNIVGTIVGGKKIFDISKMSELVRRMGLKIGIIAVPSEHAQAVCDQLVGSGIKAIWNFAPTHLNVTSEVVVKNEDLSASLAILTKKLVELESQ